MYLSRGLFLWVVQPKSRFRNLKQVDGTTQRVCVWCFQGLQNPKLPTGQILHLGKKLQLLTHKLRPDSGRSLILSSISLSKTSIVSTGYMVSIVSTFKTPPALHSVAKCFASSTQHWCLWKYETSKTAGSYEPLRICLLLQQHFFESTPSAFAVCAEGWRSLRVGELHIVASA